MRRHTRPLAAFLVSLALGFALATCASNPKPDLSQLSAVGLREFRADEAVKIVDDVTTGVRAAVTAKVLPVAVGAQLLTINKQVLDVLTPPIAADWQTRVSVLIRNGREALPTTWKERADTYLRQVQVILQGAIP